MLLMAGESASHAAWEAWNTLGFSNTNECWTTSLETHERDEEYGIVPF